MHNMMIARENGGMILLTLISREEKKIALQQNPILRRDWPLYKQMA